MLCENPMNDLFFKKLKRLKGLAIPKILNENDYHFQLQMQRIDSKTFENFSGNDLIQSGNFKTFENFTSF